MSAFSFILLSFNSPVFGFHFGRISIFSDVYTGAGNSTSPINKFDPVNREIYTNETVKWSNPTAGAPYPHIVAFISNKSTEVQSKISKITKPVQASNSNLQYVINNLNKLLIDGEKENNKPKQNFNSRSIVFPSVINSSDLSVTYLNASANLFKGAEYNMTGNETFVNSGLIWAGGMIPGKFAKINSFIVTFMNPGTYHYQCLIYPDMKGTVIVKPNPGVLGIHKM